MSAIDARLSAALADRYRIERELGAGGMATVYLAEDLKHHRRVAVKVLRAEIAASLGAERFNREIEVAAQLQHPHILPLLDSGEAAGSFYYVMPLVDGESLRERLRREGRLPIATAIRIMADVADALDHAHAHGIIHRDIKPDNVMLSGRHALVMDFGVAKAISASFSANPSAVELTGNVALGTPSYMAPEQATGNPEVDHRADLYALGIVAYEMLAGAPPFTGRTPQEILAAQVLDDPEPLAGLSPEVPPPLVAVIERCLAKQPDDRYSTAESLLADLEPLMTPSGGITPTRAHRYQAAAGTRRGTWTIAIATTVLLAALLFLGLRVQRASAMVLGHSEQLTGEAGLQITPAISPDGRLVAYAAGNSARMRTFIRPVGGGRTIPVSDDSLAMETEPRWSPDGLQLLYLTGGGVSVAPALGGGAHPVVAPDTGLGVTTAMWSPDGKEIGFVRGGSLQAVPLAGGTPRTIAATPNLRSCNWSPDNRWIACVSGNLSYLQPGTQFGNLAPTSIILVSSRGGVPIQLIAKDAANESPVWMEGGRQLLFLSNRDGPRDIYAISVSPSGHPGGDTSRLTTGLGANSFSLSADGKKLVYAVYSARANIWTVPIPSGAPVSAETATALTSDNQVVESMRVSRDGRWLLFDSDLKGNSDIYRKPLAGGPTEQLTTDPVAEFAPDLSPDSRFIAYHSFRSGTRDIEVKPLDGGPIEPVTNTPAQESFPAWSPDGRAIAFYSQGLNFRVHIVRREADGTWSPPDTLADGACCVDWSPDGRSVLYLQSNATRGPIMVVPVGGGVPRRVFQPGVGMPAAEQALWSADGRSIYFKAHDGGGRTSFWSVPAAGGVPRMLVDFPNPDRQSSRLYFAVDRRRFFFTIEDRRSNVFVAQVSAR